jgi:hypothetical protein
MPYTTESAFDSSEDESEGSVFSFEAFGSNGSSLPTELSRSSSPALSVRSMTSSLRASAYKEEVLATWLMKLRYMLKATHSMVELSMRIRMSTGSLPMSKSWLD